MLRSTEHLTNIHQLEVNINYTQARRYYNYMHVDKATGQDVCILTSVKCVLAKRL